MPIILSLNVFLPICSWMKHYPVHTTASPPAPEMFLIQLISLGLLCILSKKCLDMTLIDTPVSYSASTSRFFTLTLYSMTLSRLTSSIVTSLIC